MDNLNSIKEFLRNNSKERDGFVATLVEFESKFGHPHTSIRDKVSGPLADMLFMGEKFQKRLQDGTIMNFVYNSKIAREFLLSSPTEPTHVWEPQTTKLLLHFSKNASNVLIAGAYFGDQAIPVGINIKHSGICHTFEPNKSNSELIDENAKLNGLSNLLINNLALWNKSNEKLVFDGEDALASTVVDEKNSSDVLHTITIDDYVKDKVKTAVNLIMIDVEGSEIKVLEGAVDTLKNHQPIVVFETHSLYNDWSKGLDKSDSVQLLSKLGYKIYAIREFHQNIEVADMPIELLPLDRTFCETPPHHGFNLLAVPSDDLIRNKLFRIVYDLSPKLILPKKDVKFLPSPTNVE